MKLPVVLWCFLLPFLSSCRSTPQKKETAETRETSRLGATDPMAQVGGYYKLRKTMNGFHYNIPTFVEVLPDRYLRRGQVVQLLDPSAGSGWARVKNADLQTGYVRFENLKIVPFEDQPKPKERDPDKELDQRMKSQ